MQEQQTLIEAENEKLKRMVHTKEKLLEAQEQSNKEYVLKIKAEQREVVDSYIARISGYMMQYEELRTLSANHYDNIQTLTATIADLEEKLREMTRSRDFFESELKKKEAEYVVLMD